jgi:uncharacterized protein (TIGR02996 family)
MPGNPEMERAIFERPDDDDGYLVYGDWLQAQGDARGELIAVQAALMKSPGDRTLKQREEALLKQHGPTWLGPLAGRKATRHLWRLGCVDALTLDEDYFAKERDRDAGALLQELLVAPAGRFLRRLHVKFWSSARGQGDYSEVVSALAQARPAGLRQLFLADFTFPDEAEMSWTSLGDVSPLWPALPRLEKIILQAGAMDLGTIVAPALRHFEVRTGGLSAAAMASICAARWPLLETLKIWFGDESYGGEGTLASIAAILDGEGLGALRHLGIMNCDFVDEACAALGTSRIVAQLETLDLSLGTLSREGAERLAEQAAAFKHLRAIEVADNFLDEEAQALLTQALPNVRIGQQRDDDPDYRYVSVGE